ncbi:unnamed protein product [Timema podura]|uniref:Uncharacterized protein n=1 Tax=Timema podura TaxID=61482 RepID=A0ABN7PET5_TIMPD|nr:unnamed protein product [Timema podura]
MGLWDFAPASGDTGLQTIVPTMGLWDFAPASGDTGLQTIVPTMGLWDFAPASGDTGLQTIVPTMGLWDFAPASGDTGLQTIVPTMGLWDFAPASGDTGLQTIVPTMGLWDFAPASGDTGLQTIVPTMGLWDFAPASGDTGLQTIVPTMDEGSSPVRAPFCDTVQCPLGPCLNSSALCDGVPHCRDSMDESPSVCTRRKRECLQEPNDPSCVCRAGQLRCRNRRCVDKSSFCDGVDDCGDASDEPTTCDCSDYLKLAAPRLICDGKWNCLNKMDEKGCGCHDDTFQCPKCARPTRLSQQVSYSSEGRVWEGESCLLTQKPSRVSSSQWPQVSGPLVTYLAWLAS